MSAVTYEVTAEVRADLRDTFRQYLIEEHIPDLMNTNAFAEVTISVSGDGHLRIRYEAKNGDLLNAYFEDHAHVCAKILANGFLTVSNLGVTFGRKSADSLRTLNRSSLTAKCWFVILYVRRSKVGDTKT